jgi:formylglycine-generating enzyme required for sulfatase activity/serine/threonine protein kinase
MARQVRSAPEIPDMKVLRQIGGGSYGEIWMARSVTDTLRAVKVVYRNDFDDDRTFEREFEGILKYEPVAREHPGLVDILHVGRDQTGEEEFYFYVMELGDDVEHGSQIRPSDYEPRTLRSDMLRAGKRPLAVGFCAEAGAKLAGALTHLHSQGLAHRDVKPSNVIFVKGQACLADIGLVAARDQRTFVGTEGFVPPEGPGSAGADVYALGKVLYEMATGKDRLDFPELPDEPIPKADNKRWLTLNRIICETCDPRIKKRRYTEAADLERVLDLIHRSRRIQKKRAPLGLAASVLAVALGLGLFIGLPISPVTVVSSDQSLVAAPTTSFVTITSVPEGAEVYDEYGVLLGATPYGPKEYPIGLEVEFQLRYPGYVPKKVTRELSQADEILLASLNRYPPESGLEWRDFLGQRYFPVDDAHVSAYLVGPVEFRRSPAARNKGWKGVEVSENGLRRRAAFVTEQQGEEFVRWLAAESVADGVLPDEYRFAAEFEKEGSFEGVPEEVWEAGLRPLRIKIEPIRKGSLAIATEPAGAWVYLNDQYQGTTPLSDLEVFPGRVKLRVELDGYEEYVTEVKVSENQALALPLVQLLPTKGMPWQNVEWKNSLGMEFVEMGDELIASRWETRVGDFQNFVNATKRKQLTAPDFSQSRDHPVVNVTRTDAIEFCQWLTEKERREDVIREWHQYRLPTDAEWSRLAGVELEEGSTPRERASWERPGYPWGDEYPPTEKVANIAGVEGSGRLVLGQNAVVGYNDGFVTTAPVGSFPPNELGLHDLGGNVREWVSDFYTSEEAGFGTTRGGSWEDYREEHLRTSARRLAPDTGEGYGFRVVLVKTENKDETANDG